MTSLNVEMCLLFTTCMPKQSVTFFYPSKSKSVNCDLRKENEYMYKITILIGTICGDYIDLIFYLENRLTSNISTSIDCRKTIFGF